MNAACKFGLACAASLWLTPLAGAPAARSGGPGVCAGQAPKLLEAYRHRPPWPVAGVDACVGVPDGLQLKDPAILAVAGVSVDTNRHVVTIRGDDVVLDGYDFSRAGGWGLVIEGSDATVSNSEFVVGSNGRAPILGMQSSGSVTVKDCAIDGRNASDVGGLIEMRGSGTLRVTRSWLRNSADDIIQMHSNGSAALVLDNNLIENAGMAPGAHGDYTEFIGGPFTATIRYNTTIQTGGSTQGFMVEPDLGASPGVIETGEISHNTMVGSVSVFTGVTVADVVNTFSVHDNFFDPSQTLGGLAFSGPRGGPEDGSPKTSYFRNVDLRTGQVVRKPGPRTEMESR